MSRQSGNAFVMEEHTKDIKDYYNLGKRLGQPGQFGYALECRRKATGELFACKVINKSKFKLVSQKQAFFAQLRDEIKIMQKLNHENIIKFFEVYENPLNLYIVMQLCRGGELFDRISAKGSYSEKDAAFVLRQIVEGLRYLHHNNIAHCDLKPDNFLFLTDAEDSQLKIIDFGMSKIVRFRKYFRKFCGTPYYVAPEVIEGEYNEACDMWSIGVVMFVMLFGYPPFYVDPNEYNADNKILAKVKHGFQPESKKNYGPWFPKAIKCSDSAKDLIANLLEKDQAQRFTAEESLEHPWLKGETATTTSVDVGVLKNLKSFSRNCKFKAAVLNFLCDKVDNHQLEQLKREFKKLDKDGNGEVSKGELAEALREVDSKTSEEDVAKIMDVLDVDKDGVVSYKELCMASVNRKLMAKEERLWKAFREMDENGDGKISAEELAKAAHGLEPEEAQAMIAEVDINGDQYIDYEEFLMLFLNKSNLEDSPSSPAAALGGT